MPSSIIAGETNKKIIARIIPGTISASDPIMIKTVVIRFAANKKSIFVKVKLKLVCRFANPRCSSSEVYFIAMPVANVLAIHPAIADINNAIRGVEIESGNSSCAGDTTGFVCILKANLTVIVASPVIAPAVKKGIRYQTKFREYILNV